ncbi:MAG: helix-turn-helix transcriptional regulator [Pigmentiphaga sp.]|nr:helix-turn-helix transcriptional regulator [Pigmentiphaga sp.]
MTTCPSASPAPERGSWPGRIIPEPAVPHLAGEAAVLRPASVAPAARKPARSGFTDYLRTRQLPVNRTDVRAVQAAGLTMALVEHAPSQGIEYAPVNELIISIVLRSRHDAVLRDLGDGAQSFIDTPGLVLLTPPGHGSYWRFDSSPVVLHLGVPMPQLAALMGIDLEYAESEIRRAACRLHDDPLIGQIAERLWAASQGASANAFGFIERGLGTMLALLLEAGAAPEAALGSRGTALAPWRLRKVMDAIANQTAGVSVTELARSVGLSPDHFRRAFKAATGRSPHQAITERRIERAKAMLASTELSMTDLAIELGFSSSAHFSSRFRQVTGFSPSDWQIAFGSPN